MSDIMSHYMVPIAIGAVAIVLVLGLVNMMRGGSPNTSQKLMRMRVLLQFVAIVVIKATIWAMGRKQQIYFTGTARIYSTFSFFAATLTAFFFIFFLAAERSVACEACAPQADAATGATASAAAMAMTVSRIMVEPPVSRRRTGSD